MLRISKLADYATVVMTYLAQHNDEVCTAKMIAEKTHISVPTVSKLLKLLTQQGLLVSQRGAQGGYTLVKPAHQVTLAEIITALDGAIAVTECSSKSINGCCLELSCTIRGNWQLINRVIFEALCSISLENLATHKPPHVTATIPLNQIIKPQRGEHDGKLNPTA